MISYDEAIEILEQAGQRKQLYPIYLRFERLRLLFAVLKLDLAAPSIHIAGTSGKGSTSALTASLLQAAGYRVGLHTTPHLQTPRERMQVNGQLPTESEFARLVELTWSAALGVEANHSYGAFNSQELLFTLAVLHFARTNVDVAVIETFMGGQYDPTNIIKPLLSVVTNVDLDHTRLLGKTVESIAMVKAGVIKPATPFVTSATQAGVLKIFKQRASELNSPCIIIGQESHYRSRLLGQRGSIISAQVLNNLFANLHLRLLGRHQINNALLSLYIIQILRSRGWLIPDEAIRRAFASAFIPGRLEIVQEQPLIILDGAHNPAKTKALAQSLRRIFKHRQAVFVFAMKHGKELGASLKPLLPLATKFIVTRFSEKKSQTPALIAQLIRAHGIPATVRLEPHQALQLARRQLKKNEYLCITGSLYLVGKLRDQWHPYRTEQCSSYSLGQVETAWPNPVGEPIRVNELTKEPI